MYVNIVDLQGSFLSFAGHMNLFHPFGYAKRRLVDKGLPCSSFYFLVEGVK